MLQFCNKTQTFILWLTNQVTWSLGPYLYKLHHRDWVEEVKAPKSVQSVGGAGYVRDAQGGCVAGKDGVSKIQSAENYTVSTI